MVIHKEGKWCIAKNPKLTRYNYTKPWMVWQYSASGRYNVRSFATWPEAVQYVLDLYITKHMEEMLK